MRERECTNTPRTRGRANERDAPRVVAPVRRQSDFFERTSFCCNRQRPPKGRDLVVYFVASKKKLQPVNVLRAPSSPERVPSPARGFVTIVGFGGWVRYARDTRSGVERRASPNGVGEFFRAPSRGISSIDRVLTGPTIRRRPSRIKHVVVVPCLRGGARPPFEAPRLCVSRIHWILMVSSEQAAKRALTVGCDDAIHQPQCRGAKRWRAEFPPDRGTAAARAKPGGKGVASRATSSRY
jgi:hypothetical protein